MKLIPIDGTGQPTEPIANLPPDAVEVGTAYYVMYQTIDYTPPWTGYLALDNNVCVGTCGFKSPPYEGRIEIAYYTFAPYVGQGIATRMARELIAIARTFAPDVAVTARTLPEESASTSILRKLKFTFVGTVDDPDDGQVWEWQLPFGSG